MKQTDKQLFEESFAHLSKLASFILAQRLLPAFNSLEALFFATPLRNRSGLYPPFILSRETIRKVINTAIAQGTSWDEEFEIITEKGNHRWGRVNDDAEIRNGKCLRLYGSFQDIHARIQAENFIRIALKKDSHFRKHLECNLCS